MAPRAHWKGYLKLSLVSCPIALYPAISAAERVSFRQVNRQTGNRLRQQLVDTVTGEVVRSHDKGRGYELGERQLLLVPDEDLQAAQEEARRRPKRATPVLRVGKAPEQSEPARAAPSVRAEASREQTRPETEPARAQLRPGPVRIENNRTIEIECFVPGAQVDPSYYDTPYYIAPRDEVGQEAFAVIREVMRGRNMLGMGHIILSKRERPIILAAIGKGLRGTTLRYAHEVRSAADYFSAIPDLNLPDEMLKVAERIVEAKASDFDPAFLEDRYRTALVARLKAKQDDVPTKAAAAALSPRNVLNLMDALKRSLETARPVSEPTQNAGQLNGKSKPARTRSRARQGISGTSSQRK